MPASENFYDIDAKCFGVDLRDDGDVEGALFLANSVMSLALADLQRYSGIDLEPDLKDILKRFVVDAESMSGRGNDVILG